MVHALAVLASLYYADVSPSALDCVLTPWSEWSMCKRAAPCGRVGSTTGVEHRTRSIVHTPVLWLYIKLPCRITVPSVGAARKCV